MTTTKDINEQASLERDCKKLYQRIQSDIDTRHRPLPDFPRIATTVNDLILDPNYRAKDLVDVLEYDKQLSSLLLKVGSSSLYPGKPPCENLDMALRRIGADTTCNLVLIYTLDRLFQTDKATIRQKLKQMWAHNAKVAAIGAWITNFTPEFTNESALLAGLLHDVGALFIMAVLGEKLKTPYHWKLAKNLCEDHSNDIAVQILTHWQIPDDIIETARTKDIWLRDHNHKPDLADLLLIARYHAYLGTDRIQGCPRITDMPAAQKINFQQGEMTPFQGLKIISDYKDEIADITRTLII